MAMKSVWLQSSKSMSQTEELSTLRDNGNINKSSINVDVKDEKESTVCNYKFNAKKVMGWWVIEAKTLNSPFERSKKRWKDVRTAISEFMNEPISSDDTYVSSPLLGESGEYEIINRKDVSQEVVDNIRKVVGKEVVSAKDTGVDSIAKKAPDARNSNQAPKMEFNDEGFGIVDVDIHARADDVKLSRYRVSQRASDTTKQVGTTTANKIANDTVLGLSSENKTTASMYLLESENQDVSQGKFIKYLELIQEKISAKSRACPAGVQMAVVGITHRGVFHTSISNHAVLVVFTSKGVEIIDSKRTSPPRTGFTYHVTKFQDAGEYKNCARFAAYTAIELAKLITKEGNDIDLGSLLAHIKKPTFTQLRALFAQD